VSDPSACTERPRRARYRIIWAPRPATSACVISAACRSRRSSSFERFASLFNGPARVEIVNLPHGAEIQLHDPDLTDEAGQILWLGVLDHGWVPAPDAEWEILRPLGGERTAFAALVSG